MAGFWYRRFVTGLGVGCFAVLGGCGPQTSRVGDGVTTTTLAAAKKSVAVMRIGSASPACDHAQLLLGTRVEGGFQRLRGITVANIRSITEPAVAEIELDPGEYYILDYACVAVKGAKTVGDHGAGDRYYRSSYAAFRLEPGEIVNTGYFHFHAARVGTNAFGRGARTDVAVTDWPLNELDRYKAKRPQVYAQMVTRLMTVSSNAPALPSGDDCRRLEALKAEGKVAAIPPSCGRTAAADAPRKAP